MDDEKQVERCRFPKSRRLRKSQERDKWGLDERTDVLYNQFLMIKLWESLLSRLGIRRGGGTHSIALDVSLHTALMELAEQEQRPVEEVQADMIVTALAQRRTHGELYKRWQSLSPREQEVTALACRGDTNRQMAARMGVSEETVKTHVRNTLVKFNLHGKGELRMALEEWDFSEWDK